MNLLYRPLALAALFGHSMIFVAHAQTRGYVETDLVVNRQTGGVPSIVDSNGILHVAKFADPNLVNPWGIAESSTSAFWVANAGTGTATLYNSEGKPQTLVVSIPDAGNPLGNGGIPTGAVFNPLTGDAFPLSGVDRNGDFIKAPAVFLFVTKDGSVLGWNPKVNPPGFDPAKVGTYATVVTNTGGAYTGLAIATDAAGTTRLYAANFKGGTVDVFDTSFGLVSSGSMFVDPSLPAGYAPFNVAPITVNGKTRMFVTYTTQDLTKITGQGHGFVNTFDLDGSAPRRFSQHGQLVSPWAVVLTPKGFGELGGTLWIGNFGNGQINAFDPMTGELINKVRGPDGKAVVIDKLWTLRFGNGVSGGSANSLFFTAGVNGEQDGLFGSLDPQ